MQQINRFIPEVGYTPKLTEIKLSQVVKSFVIGSKEKRK
jgi:hypothetical protein